MAGDRGLGLSAMTVLEILDQVRNDDVVYELNKSPLEGSTPPTGGGGVSYLNFINPKETPLVT